MPRNWRTLVDRPLPWLKYVDAGDLDDGRVDFDSMDIESPTGEHLGDVDGFVVDSTNGRPYYIVVDAGGWFKSKEYLLPVGHAALDSDRQVLVTTLGREHVDRFPGFDKDQFQKLSEADIKRFNDETCTAIAGEAVSYPAAEPLSASWERTAYRYPDWWHAEPIAGDAGKPTLADLTRPVSKTEAPVNDFVVAEQSSVGRGAAVAARESTVSSARTTTTASTGATGATGAEPSPHFDGRAQPGDVLGIETGGETTAIGDTTESENARREEAEKKS
jgi:hypothetical protein